MDTGTNKRQSRSDVNITLTESPNGTHEDERDRWVSVYGTELLIGEGLLDEFDDEDEDEDEFDDEDDGFEIVMPDATMHRELDPEERAALDDALAACAGAKWWGVESLSTEDGIDRVLTLTSSNSEVSFSWNTAPEEWLNVEMLAELLVSLAAKPGAAPRSPEETDQSEQHSVVEREIVGERPNDSVEVLSFAGELQHWSLHRGAIDGESNFWLEAVDYSAAELFDEPVYEQWQGPFENLVDALDAWGPLLLDRAPISATAEIRAAALAHLETTFAAETKELQRKIRYVREGWERCAEILV